MIKFNRKNKTLAIPVGINPNYGIDSSMLYDISDADIVASDVTKGKIGYGKDGKIVGTLNIENEKEESYQAGIDEQKAKLESITITENGNYNREDGWNSVMVDVPDLNGDYNEGVEAGIVIGKAEIIDGMNDATITAGTVVKGYIGYGKDGERIVGDYESLNFEPLGYSDEDVESVNIILSDAIDYSKQLLDNWDPNTTNADHMYSFDYTLRFAPKIDTSKVTNMNRMFYNCSSLTSVPLLDTSKVTNMSSMFYNCSSLTSVPLLDTSKVTNMVDMFNNCRNLTSVPPFDTSNVTQYRSFVNGCTNLKTVAELDCSKISGASYSSANISESNETQLVDFGGFRNLGQNFISSSNDAYGNADLEYMSALTYESCMNVINKVYDMNLKTLTRTPKIIFHATPYSLLSADDIAIATSKGWTVQAG